MTEAVSSQARADRIGSSFRNRRYIDHERESLNFWVADEAKPLLHRREANDGCDIL